nr:putative ribonuclease H-like domain-containing protein [Tanacetum cinerariifolium]
MYSIDLNNVVPHKDLTCLVAKASADECMLWHRRLGHLNLKIMNRLVRNNLVKGLPSKCFKNDHTCTACLRGKQHKASCKSKLVNSVTKPLHSLHMDLFGPTSVSSISHKWYCLVVTNDFSRGYVSFGQGGCKITGKGTIKTGKLEFENVYFVKELKDDSNVLLRTPRQHNMYSIDLHNVVPHKDLTCLVAKASADECMLWHRRLGHLNLKIMNRLVRNNLVKGLPSKCFKNDHTCTACLRGKQHKAS